MFSSCLLPARILGLFTQPKPQICPPIGVVAAPWSASGQSVFCKKKKKNLIGDPRTGSGTVFTRRSGVRASHYWTEGGWGLGWVSTSFLLFKHQLEIWSDQNTCKDSIHTFINVRHLICKKKFPYNTVLRTVSMMLNLYHHHWLFGIDVFTCTWVQRNRFWHMKESHKKWSGNQMWEERLVWKMGYRMWGEFFATDECEKKD